MHDHELREVVHEHDTHKVPPTATTLTTFAALVVLAVLALGVGFSQNLGDIKVIASLAVAAIQATVLGVFFMELKQGDKLTWLCVGAAIFWVCIMFTFILTDFVTRHRAAF